MPGGAVTWPPVLDVAWGPAVVAPVVAVAFVGNAPETLNNDICYVGVL